MDSWQQWSVDEARKFVTIPTERDDKYSRGVLGVIAGSKQYPGAAILTCEAAIRTGVGMLRYLGPSTAQGLVLTHRPEVVIQDGQVQAWTIGPGIDSRKLSWRRESLIQRKLDEGRPTVLDAGAMFLIPQTQGPVLITPHYRELATYLSSHGTTVTDEEVKNAPKKWARFAADTLQVSVLLKGNNTYIASKEHEIELPPATTWLATAGTGDVLAGILGALLATHAEHIREEPELLASLAATGSFIHSRAAAAASSGGPISAMGVAHAIGKVVSDLLHMDG